MKTFKLKKSFITVAFLTSLIVGSSSAIEMNRIGNNQVNGESALNDTSEYVGQKNDNVKSVKVGVNLKTNEFTYDITFKNHDFDDQYVQSIFFSLNTDEGHFTGEWTKTPLIDATTKIANKTQIKNKHASNTASYAEINTFGDGVETSPSDIGGMVDFSILFGTEGNYHSATLNPIEIRVRRRWDFITLIVLDESKINLKLNTLQTFATISFNIKYDNSLAINNLRFKSHSDTNVNATLIDDSTFKIINGNNNFTLGLKENYHYSDLYLDFSFSDINNIEYKITGDFNKSVNFTSGVNPPVKGWTVTDYLILAFIILLILLLLFIIVLTVFKIKKRKRLEKEHDLKYFENNHL